MRLWTLHPRHLDTKGLVALWREGLLARAVLHGRTRGYRQHPQLARFRDHPAPLAAIDGYLLVVHGEAALRGYRFDRDKLGPPCAAAPIPATTGQLAYEWQHLLEKLAARDPMFRRQWDTIAAPDCHPIFDLRPGPVASWERLPATGGKSPIPPPPPPR